MGDAHDVLKDLLKEYVYDPATSLGSSTVWEGLEFYLKKGELMEAVAVLEGVTMNERNANWLNIVNNLSTQQPELARRLMATGEELPSRDSLLRILGSLSVPFTLVRSELNGLLEYPEWSWNEVWQRYFESKRRRTDQCSFFAQGYCRNGDNCSY